MKINKKQAAVAAGLVCVVLLLLLLLSMCAREEAPAPTVPSETAAVETTQQTEEATEPTEETTEATEETTEATEETTEATEPSGNTRPGGTSGYNPGLDSGGTDTGTTTEPTTPEAGSEDSPYLEFVAELPGQIQTVAISTNGTVYQNLMGLEACVLTIEDPDAYVVYGETTYEPDDLGVVNVPILPGETENTPVTLRIGNKNDADKAFTLCFLGPVGSAGNPEPLTAAEDGTVAIKTVLEAGDTDGWFYGFTAEENSRLTLQLDKITENTACDIIVTVNDVVTKLSECEEGLLSVEVKQGDTALIQVVAIPGEDGTYPAVEAEISGTVESAPGSEANPIVVYGEFPIVTEKIAPGASVFYNVFGANDMTLTVENAQNCVITVDGVTYAAVDGVITAAIKTDNPRNPVVIVVGNSGEDATSFTLELVPPLGSMNNPAAMVEGTNTAVIEAGDIDGYWFTWTADADAVVTITMPDGDWTYQLEHVSGDIPTYGDIQWSDSDPVVSSVETKVVAGDVLNLMVNTYDPADMFSNPAGEICFQLSVVQHLDVWSAGAEVSLAPGETVFCKAVIRAESIILKVAGEGEFTVNVNGRDHKAVDGLVAIDGFKSEMYQPQQFTITNDGEETLNCKISYENPVGSSMNPEVLTQDGAYSCTVTGDGEGYFYTWIAPANGELTVTMECEDWTCVLNNLTTSLYGDIFASDGDTESETLTVSQGDEIQINLGTASLEPGDVDFAISFEKAPVDVTGYGATLELQPGETAACYARINAESIILKVTGTGDFTVTMGSQSYKAENGVVSVEGIASTFYAPAEFSVTNNSDAAVTYSLTYENPVGTLENPMMITEMSSYTAAVKGDGQGYYFGWIATEDGEFTVTMACDDWAYTINNLGSYRYGNNQISTAADAASSETWTVKAGDEIQIILGTASRENKNVSFTVSFQTAQQDAEEDTGAEDTNADDVTDDVTTGGTDDSGAETGDITETGSASDGESTEGTETGTESTQDTQTEEVSET